MKQIKDKKHTNETVYIWSQEENVSCSWKMQRKIIKIDESLYSSCKEPDVESKVSRNGTFSTTEFIFLYDGICEELKIFRFDFQIFIMRNFKIEAKY